MRYYEPHTGDYGRGDNYPMYFVCWYDAIEFCNRLNVAEGLTPVYEIPTTSNESWSNFIVDNWTTGVGSFSPNAWGLYDDIHGNVFELYCDWIDGMRVSRGGSWNDSGEYLRSASGGLSPYPYDRYAEKRLLSALIIWSVMALFYVFPIRVRGQIQPTKYCPVS